MLTVEQAIVALQQVQDKTQPLYAYNWDFGQFEEAKNLDTVRVHRAFPDDAHLRESFIPENEEDVREIVCFR